MERINKRISTALLTKISVLSVISFLIMYIEVPMWFTPEFLKIDLSDLPALIGSFSLGPIAGVVIELVKNLLKFGLKGTTTLGVGEIANFIVGAIYVWTAGYVYSRSNNFKGAVRGMLFGTIVMSVVASALNYVFLIPFYAKLYGLPIQAYIDMAKAVNKYVVSFETFIIFGILPFNILKGILVSLVTMPLYKRLGSIISK